MSELMQISNWLDIELGNMFGTISETTDSEYEVEGNISEVEHKSYDGFIPFTNGGVQFIAPIDLGYLVSTGGGFVNKDITKEIEKTVDYCYIHAREQFIADKRKELNKTFVKAYLDNNSDRVNYHVLYDMNRGSLAEDLSEYEMAWLEGTLFVEHRAQFYSAENHYNKTGSDEICFISGVNTDYDYGRQKGLTMTYTQTFKVKDLTPAVLETILKSMLQSI